MVVVIRPENHLSHFLHLLEIQLYLVFTKSLPKIRDVKILERRIAGLGHGVIGVFIERIGQPLIASIMSKSRKEHEDSLTMRNLKFFLPPE